MTGSGWQAIGGSEWIVVSHARVNWGNLHVVGLQKLVKHVFVIIKSCNANATKLQTALQKKKSCRLVSLGHLAIFIADKPDLSNPFLTPTPFSPFLLHVTGQWYKITIIDVAFWKMENAP